MVCAPAAPKTVWQVSREQSIAVLRCCCCGMCPVNVSIRPAKRTHPLTQHPCFLHPCSCRRGTTPTVIVHVCLTDCQEASNRTMQCEGSVLNLAGLVDGMQPPRGLPVQVVALDTSGWVRSTDGTVLLAWPRPLGGSRDGSAPCCQPDTNYTAIRARTPSNHKSGGRGGHGLSTAAPPP